VYVREAVPLLRHICRALRSVSRSPPPISGIFTGATQSAGSTRFCETAAVVPLSRRRQLWPGSKSIFSLGTEETLGKQASLPRGKQKALAKDLEFLCQVQFFSLSAKKFLKITFLPPNFFYPQHTLIKKTYAQSWHNFSYVCYI
jgi:hypothetical protein